MGMWSHECFQTLFRLPLMSMASMKPIQIQTTVPYQHHLSSNHFPDINFMLQST